MQHEKKGFGYVYQNVMRDKKLTVEAKSIYAYLASFAGNNESCFPGVDLMIIELGISKTRFYKHMQLLLDNGIILKQQEKQGNKFSKNTYTINSFPSFNDTQNEDTQNKDTQIEDTQNLTNNSNSFKTNSINSNNKKSIPSRQKRKYGEFSHVLLTDMEKERLISELGQDIFDKCITKLDEYIEVRKPKYNNHNLVIRKWVIKAVQEDDLKNGEKGGKQTYGEAYGCSEYSSTDYYEQFRCSE